MVTSSNQRHPQLPSCCSLCLPLEVALFQGVETGSQIATAPRRGYTMCHHPGRHQDHLRPKVPAGVQEFSHCPDTSLLPPSDSRGHNSPSPTLQAGAAEGTEADRGRDNR